MNILKRAILSCAFVCALAVSGFAQSADDNTITGNVYDAFNNPLVGFSFTVTVTRRDGVAVSSAPKTVTTITAGALPSTFQLPRRSFVTFRGGFTIGRYNFTNGVSLFVPDESTTSIYNLKSVEDAAAALVEVAAAPSDAQYIVGTANGTLSAEQSLGALTTGLLKNTVSGSTGTLSTAVAADLPLISTLTADATPDSAADYVLTYDASAGVHKKVLLSNLPSSGGGGTWGSITGTLSSQTDLQSALDLKANLISPSFTTPTLGVASATSINKLAITTPATGSTLAIADGKTFTASNTITLTATDGSTLAIGAGGTLGSAAYTASSAYEVPLTFSTGLTRSTNTITVNTSQNIATLSNLTSNGIVTTSGGGGTLGVTVPGTGVLTALGVNVGSAGAPVLFNGAGGTPSSLTLTNATGLPLSTGVTGDLPFANFVQAGSAGFVGATGAGDYAHRTPTQVTAALDAFTGDSGSGGVKGLVPAPAAGDAAAGKFLKADGTFAVPSGGGGLAVGTTTITGGSNTDALYNNSGVLGSRTVTGSGNAVLSTSPIFTTDITTPIVKSAAGADLAANATAPAATTGASKAGKAVTITASAAVASTDTAGAAAGGSVTITAGAAARLTSGNANGGNINLATGAGIGTGSPGNLVLTTASSFIIVDSTASGNGDIIRWGSATNRGMIAANNGVGFTNASNQASLINLSGGLSWSLSKDAIFAWSTSATSANATSGLILRQSAAANLALGSTDTDLNANIVAQKISVQNAAAGGTSDQAGKDFTIAGSQGKGTGAGGSIIFQTAPAGSTGSTQNSLVTAVTIGPNGALFPKAFTFSALPTISDGGMVYCSDCAQTTPYVNTTCVGSGTGAMAYKLNSTWRCFN